MKAIASPKDDDHAVMIASVLHQHARTCKEHLDDCRQCRRNMAWFATLPLPTLSTVLADRPALHTRIVIPATL